MLFNNRNGQQTLAQIYRTPIIEWQLLVTTACIVQNTLRIGSPKHVFLSTIVLYSTECKSRIKSWGVNQLFSRQINFDIVYSRDFQLYSYQQGCTTECCTVGSLANFRHKQLLRWMVLDYCIDEFGTEFHHHMSYCMFPTRSTFPNFHLRENNTIHSQTRL